MISPSPSASELRAAFDRPAPLTVGLEEELMLLDPRSLDLATCAQEALARSGGDARYKLELPASQLEITLPPARSVPEAAAWLRAARRELARAVDGLVRPAALAVHPFAVLEGEVNRGERYDRTHWQYGMVARQQLVCALQVHVAVGGADRTLAVYNALRSHLPELAALAAAAPFQQGRDTGFASVRPLVARQLPRQGVPPPIESWEAFADAVRWGEASGWVVGPRSWWWELRPHRSFGTLEIRVPDAQASVRDAASVAAVVHSLVAHLAAEHDAGGTAPAVATWRIEENRWSACRWGVEGELADLQTGERAPTRARLHALLDELEPRAEALGCPAELANARALVEVNGAMRHREIARQEGARALAAWLADRFIAEG
jgi:glutamate---cysteine ligase / carboxylate-amine ligase